MEIAYIANMRLPTEKAHGLQIVENCAALAASGAAVTLVVPRRINTAALRHADPWRYYSVPRSFSVVRLPCIDLFPLGRAFEPVAARIESLTFTIAVLFWALGRRQAIFYSRHEWPLLMLSAFVDRGRLAYEAHLRLRSTLGTWVQRRCVAACATRFAVTRSLADYLDGDRIAVLRDGFRAERFDPALSRKSARAQLHLPADACIVGYVGRLRTMGHGKGVADMVHACARAGLADLHFCVVGGPSDETAALARDWQAAGLPPERFHAAGEVEPAEVPTYLTAFDICTLTLPWTPHFAHDASPLKLFEYLAAGRVVLATCLPSIEEVVTHDRDAWLVPPNDIDSLAAALRTLHDDPGLRTRLEAGARDTAAQYSWTERSRRIRDAIDAARQRGSERAAR